MAAGYHVPSTDALLSIVVLGLFCTAAAFVLFGALIGEIGPGRATVITYISPIVAVSLGVAVSATILPLRSTAISASEMARSATR